MILEKLKIIPKDIYLAIITVAAFVLFMILNIFVFGPINAATPPYSILDLEFAWTVERAREILDAWGSEGNILQTLGVYWDMAYIFGYGFFIFGCILLVSRRLEGALLKIGLFICLTPLIAGVFDFVENLNLLVMLYSPTSFTSITPMITGILATIKFAFLLVGIVFFFIVLVIFIVALLFKKLR